MLSSSGSKASLALAIGRYVIDNRPKRLRAVPTNSKVFLRGLLNMREK